MYEQEHDSERSIRISSDQEEEKTHMPWIEKYRPTHFDGIVLDPLNRTFFRNILEKRHFPNLLFYGPPGTGKTTTIINLINEYQNKYTRKNRESIIHLNASDERGIDIIRTQIYQFVKSKHIFEVGLKFVILDEVDYMTKNAQQALKTLLQTALPNVRFCLICNYISKIDESLQHEFLCVRFNQLPRREIRQFISAISEKESIDVDAEDIDQLCDTYQSDIRSMINYLQSSHSTRDTNAPKTNAHDWEKLHQLLIRATTTPDEVLSICIILAITTTCTRET
jgi:replication factor C subunit 3/5